MNNIKSNYIKNKKTENMVWGYFMIAPTMLGLFVLNILPIFQSLYLSFTKSGAFGKVTFIGLKNYVNLFQDKLVMQSFINTFIYTILTVSAGVFLSLVTAVLLNAKIRGKTVYRTLFFLPVVSVPAAVALVWKWIFNSKFGIINTMLTAVGMKGVDWLTDSLQ